MNRFQRIKLKYSFQNNVLKMSTTTTTTKIATVRLAKKRFSMSSFHKILQKVQEELFSTILLTLAKIFLE